MVLTCFNMFLTIPPRFSDVFGARQVESEPHVNAIVVKDYERARARARELDIKWEEAKGQGLGHLHGLPMTVKEEFAVQGMRRQLIMDENSCVAVQRLLDAGAIIFGKSNTPVNCRDWQTYNELFGATVNPHDAQRSCGGSSGGSCVAVACGHSPVELGADVAGSIRVPAAFCGVFGMQGTYGRIPTTSWTQPWPTDDRPAPEPLVAPALDHSTAHLTVAPHILKVIGPICQCPEDLQLMNRVLERHVCLASPPFRLAMLSELAPGVMLGSRPLEPPLGRAVREAVLRLPSCLEGLQAVKLVTLQKTFPGNCAPVSYDLYHQMLKDRDKALDPVVVSQRHWCKAVWNAFFDANGLDAILMPISPSLPFLRNEVAGMDAYHT